MFFIQAIILALSEISQKIVDDIRNSGIASFYDSGGSIGKRYRRQDEAGTPFGITVDHDTLEDNTVTLRDRDTMKQERISIDKIIDILNEKLQLIWTSGYYIKLQIITKLILFKDY